MSRISETDLRRLRVWLEGMRAMASEGRRAPLDEILARDILSSPEIFAAALEREEDLRTDLGALLGTSDARKGLAGSYDALRRLVAGGAAAAASPSAGPAGPPDQKKALLAYILREEPRVDRQIREANFLDWAEELGDDDLVWLRNQLMIHGRLKLAALVAFLIADASGEEAAFATLRAAAEETRDVGQLARLYLTALTSSVVRRFAGDASHRDRLRAALPGFVQRMEGVVAGQAEISIADQDALAHFYGAVGGILNVFLVNRLPDATTAIDIELMEGAMGRAADLYAGIGDHPMAAGAYHLLALTFSRISSERTIPYYERAAGAYERWLELHPEEPAGEPRIWEYLFRNEEAFRLRGIPAAIDSRAALFRRAEALFSALQIAQLGGEEGEFRRLRVSYDAALGELGRRVGRAMRELVIREIDRRSMGSLSQPLTELLAFYRDLLSAEWMDRSPAALLTLSNLVGLVVVQGNRDAMQKAAEVQGVFAHPVNPGRAEAFARIVFDMPQEATDGIWSTRHTTPEMIAAAKGEDTESFWNGIFDLVLGGETGLFGKELGKFAISLERAFGPGRGRPLTSTFVAVSLRHAGGDFEFRRILMGALATAVGSFVAHYRSTGGAPIDPRLLEPLERIAGLLENPDTYEEGLRAGAEYARIPYRGRSPRGGTPPSSGPAGGGDAPVGGRSKAAGSGSTPAGSEGGAAGRGHGDGAPATRSARALAGKRGPQLSFGGLVDGTADATPVPEGDPDAADTTIDAGAAWYLGADVTGAPLAPTAAPGVAPVR